jgi:hypothetical protein
MSASLRAMLYTAIPRSFSCIVASRAMSSPPRLPASAGAMLACSVAGGYTRWWSAAA